MRQDLGYELDAVMPAVIDTGLLSSLCTIQQRTTGVSATGQPDLTDWIDTALVNIPCQLSVQRPYMPNQDGTLRKPEQFDTIHMRHVLLNGYYPQILESNRAIVDGTAYEIMTVESDSQKRQTRLAVRAYAL